MLTHIPDKGQVTTRYYRWYANRPRGIRRHAEPTSADAPALIVTAPRLARRSHIGPALLGEDPPRGRPDDPRRGQRSHDRPPDRTRAPRAVCEASPFFHSRN